MSDGQRDDTEEGLRMDEDSPISRVERTFWTVWSYITGAVNRFFRPEPTNVTNNDQNSIQDSAVDSEPANCGHAEGDTSGGGVDEEQPVATAALLSSSRPLVAWELCSTEINLGPDEESMPCETQLSRGNKSEASEEGEGTREEQSGQAGSDDAGVAQDDKREENGDEKLHTRRQDEMPENGETEEHANVRSLKTTGDAVREDMEESRRGGEDTEKAVTLDETIQVKEAEDKMQHEDEQDLQVEDSKVKLCLTADLTAAEEDNMHVEEAKMQRNEADTAVMHEEVGNTDGVPQLASESESDEGARQVEHQLSAREKSSDDHRDFKEDPGFSPLHVELQMTCDKSSIVSEDEPTAVEQQHVAARRSESDEVGDTKEETDGSTLDVSEAANNQTMDEAPEQEDDMKTLVGVIVSEHVTYREEAMQHSPEQEEVVTHSEEFVQNAPEEEDDIKTVTEDMLSEHVTCSEEAMQNALQMEEEIKTVAEDIITEHVLSSSGFVQNAPEREDDITTVTDDTLTEHVTHSEEFVQYSLEQEDDSLTEHVTGSEEFMQNVPELEKEIKTVAEDIITEVVISSCEFVQNALEQEDDTETVTEEDSLTEHATCSAEAMQNSPEQEDDITTVTDDTLTEHVTCREEFVQYSLEQEDDSLTEHVTGSVEFVQNAPEQEDDIETVSEDILTEHVACSEEFVQDAPEQEDHIKTVTEGDSLTEHATCSAEAMQNAPEREDDITTVTDDTLTEHVTRSEEFLEYVLEQEDDILTEHVTGSVEFVQNASELEEEIKTVTEDIITEHVISSGKVVQNAPEQEDDIETVTENILTEHVTRSEEVTQNAPEQDDDIKTVSEENILTAYVTYSEEVTQNAPDQDTCSKDAMQNSLDQDDDIKKVSEDILTEHVTCSHEFMQNAPEPEDNMKTVIEHILTEHITYGEDVAQHSLEQGDDIKAVTEDIIIEHVTCSEEFVQHAPEQEDNIITEHVTCSEEVTHHSPEQEDDIETLTAHVLTERVTCSDDITQNAPEQDDIETATEDDILTEHVTHSEEFMQNAESELHTADFADVEQEDVAEDTEVQTKTREADDDETESHGSMINTNSDITTHISADESYFAQEEEQSLSSAAVNRESDMEIARTATSVMDKPDGETGQEMSGEFKNIPQSMCEGRVVVLEELNSPTCEETREGVPEYNNEPDENTTQRFLEDRGYEEIQGSPLPEEVESKEPERLQNSGWSAGADCLLVREHIGEEQGVKNSFDSVVGDHAEILRLAGAGMPQEIETPLVEAVIQGSGHLVEVADGELLVDSVKTGIEEKTEEESESDLESTNKDDKATEEPRDGTEELLVDLENDEGLCDSKVAVAAGVGWETTGALAAQEVLEDDTLPEAEVQKTAETSYFQGLVDAMNSEQHLTSSLLDDITQSEFLKHSNETESVLLEDVGIQDAGLEAEETGYAVEVEAAADEMQGRNEMEIFHPQATEMAESELRGPVESLETKYQPSDEVLEISSVEMLPEAAGESKTAQSEPQELILISTEDTTKHVTESEGSHAEETVSSISGHADVIDEEILDLWMQTASSEDNDGIQRQEGPEPGQQMEPSNEELGEISSAQTEKDEEQLVDLVSDAEMSSSTVESGFLDQSLGEWGTQSNETQQAKSASTESFQGIHDLLGNMSESADISQSSAQHSDFLMEETAETDLKQDESITAAGFHPDSGVTSPEKGDLNQESDKSQEETEEERVEAVETETASQEEISAEEAELAEKTDWKDTEEADVQSEKTQAEDEPLEMSDSADEIKHTESERSGSSSEASLEEGVVSTESGSQDDTCTESERLSTLPSLDEPQPRQSEDIAESEAGAEVAEKVTAKSEDEMEVDTFVLDFSVQRSRIAVKNPRVRPPKDPRSLLHMPSLDPTPILPRPPKVPIGVPLGGMGIGIKLPGLGAGFPVLKKTQRVVRDENKSETPSEETKPEEKSDTPKQDEAPHRPKWMPPKHPGFGNPLMSELKSKLKKTTQE